MASADHAINPPPAPGGMGTAGKLLLGCGIGCGVLSLLCCGAFVGLIWLGLEILPKTMIQDSDEVRTVAAKIATIEIPPALRPEAAVDLQVPFTGQPLITCVVYTDEQHHQVLAMAEFAGPFESADQQSLREQIDQALTARGDKDHRDDFEPRESRDIDVTIRGSEARFRIEQGEGHDHRQQIRAKGQFPGHRGTALLFLQVDAENQDVDQVEQMIRSIR